MIIKVIFLVLVILTIILYVAQNILSKKLVDIALYRYDPWYDTLGHGKMSTEVKDKTTPVEIRRRYEHKTGNRFWKRGKRISLQSGDGLKLSAKVFGNDTQKWVIAVHGYRSNGRRDMAFVGSKYAQAGYSVLIPDLRAHGASEGDYIGMGWLDRNDLLVWIDWLLEHFPEASIILHGGSMGASTVLMTSGEKLPPNVRLLVADSGFASVYSQFYFIMKHYLRLPKFPFMRIANRRAKKNAGYSLIQASALKQLGSNHLPLLVIHGTEDMFVPVESARQIVSATAGEYEYLEVPGAGHLRSMSAEPEKYWDTVFDFIEKHGG